MKDAPMRHFPFAAVLVLALALAACATRPSEDDPVALAAYEEANDPLEPFNRAMWDFNDVIYNYVLRPLNWTYRKVVPKPIRTIVNNVYTNAQSSLDIVFTMLQGDFGRTWQATQRLLVNTTLGLGGMADVATEWGIEATDEDFGQVLASWGIPSGPYLVLPLLGPTNPRDGAAFIGQSFAEPVGLGLDIADKQNARIGWQVGGYWSFYDRNRDALDEVFKADDPYTFARSAFRQNRRFLIGNGELTQSKEEEELFEQDLEDFPAFEPPEPKAKGEGQVPDSDVRAEGVSCAGEEHPVLPGNGLRARWPCNPAEADVESVSGSGGLALGTQPVQRRPMDRLMLGQGYALRP